MHFLRVHTSHPRHHIGPLPLIPLAMAVIQTMSPTRQDPTACLVPHHYSPLPQPPSCAPTTLLFFFHLMHCHSSLHTQRRSIFVAPTTRARMRRTGGVRTIPFGDLGVSGQRGEGVALCNVSAGAVANHLLVLGRERDTEADNCPEGLDHRAVSEGSAERIQRTVAALHRQPHVCEGGLDHPSQLHIL